MTRMKAYKYEFNIFANQECGDHRILKKFDGVCPYFSDKMKLSGNTCVDIGGHIGVFSLVASRLFKNVYSFEPLVENLFLFNQNIVANGVMNVEVANEAVTNDQSTLPIRFYSENLAGASFYTNSKYKDKNNKGLEIDRMVYTTSPDKIIKRHKLESIDFLKISANHSEYQIINSITKDTFKMIKNIGIEYNLESPTSHKILQEKLARNGFKTEIKENGYTGYILAYR